MCIYICIYLIQRSLGTSQDQVLFRSALTIYMIRRSSSSSSSSSGSGRGRGRGRGN